MNFKTAIVTGASSGIGRITAITLNAAGWNIVLTARRNDKLEETQSMCPSPKACLIVSGDVTSEQFVQELFGAAVTKFGRIDLLFNNAGANAPKAPIEEVTLETFQHVLNVNITGPFLCAKEAFKIFKKQEPQGGRIINNGSISAHAPRPCTYAYTSSKHAILGLTKCLALDGREFNISCTQLDLGNALTDMSYDLSIATRQADGRIVGEATMDAQHIANGVLHIANLPNEIQILQYTIMPGRMPFVGRG